MAGSDAPEGGGGDEGVVDEATVRRLGEAEFFRTVAENTSDGILAIDESSRIVYANPAVEEIFGHAPGELVGGSLLQLVPERLEERHLDALDRYLATGERTLDWDRIELPGRHADGHEIDLLISFQEVRHDGGHLFVGLVRDVTERNRRERELAAQRREREELDRINTVIRDVNAALIGASTREEIYRTVCERLAAADPYAFVWIGERHPSRAVVESAASAGRGEGYLDRVTVTADETETGRGPTGRALRTGEPQVVQDVREDPDYEPWREPAAERDYRSSAAIPIGYGGVRYGVLNLYADRPDAFDDRELGVLTELAGTIGHAVNAAESRKLLQSDTAVEVKLRMDDDSSFFVRASAELDCTFRLDGTVPAEANSYLYYVRLTGADPEAVVELATADEQIRDVRQLDESPDGGLLLFRVAGSSAVLALIEAGTDVKSAVADDGEGTFVVDVSPDAELHAVVEAVRQSFPSAELVARREVERSTRTPRAFRAGIVDRLTDRQRAALEAAYRGDYFDRPRTVSGNELAESLGISASTFHQHLQAALDKVVGGVFDEYDQP